MTQLFSRVVVLVNETNRVIKLKERRRSAPDGFYSYIVQVDASNHKKIGATMFHRRAKEAGRPTVIRIFVQGVGYFDDVLTPQVFIQYFRISVRVGEDAKVKVRGVRATPTDQLRRIRLFHYLIRSDDHGGRVEDTLMEEKEIGSGAALH